MIVAATGAAMVGLPALVQGKALAAGVMPAFSDADIALLDEIAETILPRTKTPGAKDAGAGRRRRSAPASPISTRAPVPASHRSRQTPVPRCCARWMRRQRHARPR
ncbi:hypothetical protein G6F57_017269 [Rhizopus arrhizus]|nr:hypothetical protein G6F57_017269 [Rhizopus arrhizus]